MAVMVVMEALQMVEAPTSMETEILMEIKTLQLEEAPMVVMEDMLD